MQVSREETLHSLICCMTKQCKYCAYNTCDSEYCKEILIKDIKIEINHF